MAKSVSLSVRLDDEEASFLSAYEATGAVTPSEKMRAILHQARRRQEGIRDFAGCAALMEDLLRPSLTRLRKAQRANGVRSDFVMRLHDRLPELLAELVVSTPDEQATERELLDFERKLSDQVFGLIEEVVDMGLTSSRRSYDPELVKLRLKPILELCLLINLAETHDRREDDE